METGKATKQNNPDFEERMAPTLYLFEKIGDGFSGILREMNEVNIGTPPKPCVEYVIERPQGMVKILQTYDLKQKLFRRDINHKVGIEFAGEDAAAGRNGNPMMVFKVLVGKNPVE